MKEIVNYNSYDVCLSKVNKLEAIRKNELQDSTVAGIAAKLVYDYSVGELWYIEELVKELAAGQPANDRGSTEAAYLDDMDDMRKAQGGDRLTESPHDQLTSYFLLSLVTPLVHAVRQVVFGTEEAPFVDFDSGMDWIDKGLAAGGRALGEVLFIYEKAAEISEVTNFTTTSVLEYILLNWAPILPKFILEGHSKVHKVPFTKRNIRNTWLTVHLFSDLSFDELSQLYQRIRRYLGTKQSKAFNEKHLELYEKVLEKGGPPTKRVKLFWESIRKEWNEEHKDKPYATWQGVKMTYERIREKLKLKYEVGEEVKKFELSNEFGKPEVLTRRLRWRRPIAKKEVKEDETRQNEKRSKSIRNSYLIPSATQGNGNMAT